MPNLPMSVLTVPTEIEGEVVPTSYEIKDATARAGVSATVDLLKDTTGWLGGNILPIKLSDVKKLNTSGTWSGNAYTISNVTFTFTEVNGYVTEITVNGTPTTTMSVFVTKPFSMSAGRYVLTADVITSNNFDFQIYRKTDSSDYGTPSLYARADRMEGDLVDGNYHARIHISNGYAVNNVVLKPMLLTKEQYVFNPAYRPYHESVEDWYWSENAKKSVHNIFNPALFVSGADANMATVNSDGSSIRVKVETAGTYRLCAWYLNVTPNTDYTVKTSVAITSGKCAIKAETTGGTNIKTSDALSADGDIEMTFNSGNNTRLKFDIFCTWDVSGVGDVTCNNLFIKETADTYNNFLPYAMTNRELTESLKYRNVQLTPVPNTGTNYEKVVNVAEQLDALITDVGVKFSGYVLWTQSMFLRVEAMRCNATTLLYTIFNVSNTIYNGAVQNGAVTVYKFEGTQMTS